MNSAAMTIVRRPLTAACWRETLYLIAGFATATAAFVVVVTGLSLSLSLSILVVGLPIAVAFIYLNRLFCSLDRLLAKLVLDRPIERPYRPLPQGSLLKRGLSVITSAAAWRDIAWMVVSFPVAVATFTVAVTAWATSLGLLTLPIWWRINDTDSRFINDLLGKGHFEPLQLLGIPVGILLVIVSAWLVRACALAQASLAAELLRPTREAELETRVESLTHTRAGAVDAAVTELERVERDLHDGAQARLVALNIDLGLAEQRLAAGDEDAARTHIAEAREQAQVAMGDLRDLVRGIGPSILRDRGLEAALNSIAIGTTPPVNVDVELPPGKPDAAETAAYFVCVEAIANAVKHAAAGRIDVQVRRDGSGRIVAEISDDGRGGADPVPRSGLAGLQQRVAALDGTLSITSPPGGPTIVRAEI
ncbi:MAG: sensor histidine kinase [Solirubrobacteraceae bacterium]